MVYIHTAYKHLHTPIWDTYNMSCNLLNTEGKNAIWPELRTRTMRWTSETIPKRLPWRRNRHSKLFDRSLPLRPSFWNGKVKIDEDPALTTSKGLHCFKAYEEALIRPFSLKRAFTFLVNQWKSLRMVPCPSGYWIKPTAVPCKKTAKTCTSRKDSYATKQYHWVSFDLFKINTKNYWK